MGIGGTFEHCLCRPHGRPKDIICPYVYTLHLISCKIQNCGNVIFVVSFENLTWW